MATERERTDLPRAGTMPLVAITGEQPSLADQTATRLLFDTYTDKDGFHCPVCGVTITNPNEAIDHLRDEINASITAIPRTIGQAKPKEK